MKETISLTYPHSIYPNNLILHAALDYKNICCVKCQSDSSSTVCTFSDSVADLELVAKEFSNYLIELALSGVGDK